MEASRRVPLRVKARRLPRRRELLYPGPFPHRCPRRRRHSGGLHRSRVVGLSASSFNGQGPTSSSAVVARGREMRYRQDMETPGMSPRDGEAPLDDYPLLSALRERRSRRFGLGMKMPEGPLAWANRHSQGPLTEAEE